LGLSKGKLVNIPIPCEVYEATLSYFLTPQGSLSMTVVIFKQDNIAEYCNSEKQYKLRIATVRWFRQSLGTVKKEITNLT